MSGVFLLATPDAPNGTIWDRLDAHGITWNDYTIDLPDIWLFPNFATVYAAARIKTFHQFHLDCANGTLPQVSIISPGGTTYSEESPADVQNGEAYSYSIITAVLGLHVLLLADSVTRMAGNLSHGQKQWLEIGMLLMQDPKLLLLDEPVAGMTDEETERTAELFLSLEGNHSLVVVEHDMKFIGELTQGKATKKVTVLHEGSVLAEGSLDQVSADPRVVEVYLGR